MTNHAAHDDLDFEQLTHAFDDRIAPAPAFSDRLRRQLHAEAAAHTGDISDAPTTRISGQDPSTPRTPRRLIPLSGRSTRRKRPHWMGAFETAAAIVLVVAVAFGTIYGLQKDPPTEQHGNSIVASPAATANPTIDDTAFNWGGDAGHSWAFALPSWPSKYATITQGGESSGFTNVFSVISNGELIVTSGPTDGSDGMNAYRVEAFNLNQSPRWTSSLWIMPGMAIDDTQLYAITVRDATEHPGSANRQLVAISLATGEITWTGPDIGTTGKTRFSWAPVVNNGVVYVADAKGSTYAVNAADGSTIWESPVPDDAIPARADGSSVTQTGGVLAMNDQALYVAGWVNTIRRLDPQTGKELAVIQLPDDTRNYDLQFRGDTLVATGVFDDENRSQESTLVAIDTATDTIRWSQNLPTSFGGNLVLLGDRVIVPRVDAGTSGPPINFDSYDLQTGDRSWIAMESLNLKNASISALDGPAPLLFVAGSDGSLTVVNANSGDVIAEQDSGLPDDGTTMRPLPVFVSGEALIFVQPNGNWFRITPGS